MHLASGTLRLIAAASAPSAITHLALGSTPASSSSVASRTPVHSAHETRPWIACALMLRLQGVERARIAAALDFDEGDARFHRVARERLQVNSSGRFTRPWISSRC